MIRIRRPRQAPAILRTKGDARRQQDEAAYQQGRDAYRAGRARFDFDSKIYGHPTVKKKLLRAQHKKCAFCESKPLHVSPGDVEHFRPKRAVRLDGKTRLDRPGYYWLAYEWTNLLFACEECNRRHKKNEFPLADPARRARTHLDDLTNEDPLFIDPAGEDPEAYIDFREHMPFATGGNERGERTLDALGLRRPELNTRREEHLALLKMIFDMAHLPGASPSERAHAQDLLHRMTSVSAEYAAMSRAAVQAWQRT